MQNFPQEEVKQEENIPQENMPGETLSKPPQGTFLERIKTHAHVPTSFVQSLLIPGAIIILVLLIGGGGTYLIASSVFSKPVPAPSTVSSISESDIPKVPTIAIPTPTPNTGSASTASSSSLDLPTPSPTGSVTANWTPYNFGVLFLNFSYPPGWYLKVASTSGAPYLTVQNFSGPTPANTTGSYTIFIGRLEQVGITTVSALTTQLALNDANNTYVNGVNVGQVTVVSSTPTTVNGYLALTRTVTYSLFPTVQQTELYVLDGVSNVVKFIPQLDTSFGQPYFNGLVSTIKFTN